jgi:hypothetical protein
MLLPAESLLVAHASGAADEGLGAGRYCPAVDFHKDVILQIKNAIKFKCAMPSPDCPLTADYWRRVNTTEYLSE